MKIGIFAIGGRLNGSWILIAGVLIACNESSNGSLQTNIQSAYQDCDKREIGLLKKMNNVQTVFEDCGSNHITHYNWSTDGQLLYFQLFETGYLLNPTNQGVDPVPVGSPVGRGTWITTSRLAVPVKGDTSGSVLLALYHTGGMLDKFALKGSEPQDLQIYDEQNILLTMIDAGVRKAFLFNHMDQSTTEVFPFLSSHESINNLEWASEAKLLAVTDNTGASLYDDKGSLLKRFEGVKRATPHADGNYIALEVDGTAIPTIPLESVTYKTDKAKAREEARRQKQLEALPSWMPKETIPPEIHIYNLKLNRRYRLKNAFGSTLIWYRAQKYFATFTLRGLGGNLVNPNVGFMDIGIPLLMADEGDFPSSIELISSETEVEKPTTLTEKPTTP